jgi:hypothetical protein
MSEINGHEIVNVPSTRSSLTLIIGGLGVAAVATVALVKLIKK